MDIINRGVVAVRIAVVVEVIEIIWEVTLTTPSIMVQLADKIRILPVHLLIIVIVLLLLLLLLILSLFLLLVLIYSPSQVVCQLCFQLVYITTFCPHYFSTLAFIISSISTPNALTTVQSDKANDIT